MNNKNRSSLTETMFYVLMSLWRRQLCGAEITEFVAAKTAGRVRLGPGTLYVLLNKFQEEELISEIAVEGRKRTYQITAAGRAAFIDELERLQACISDGQEEIG